MPMIYLVDSHFSCFPSFAPFFPSNTQHSSRAWRRARMKKHVQEASIGHWSSCKTTQQWRWRKVEQQPHSRVMGWRALIWRAQVGVRTLGSHTEPPASKY
jgi:hypothetical protein